MTLEELGEYLFILKNTLAGCQRLLGNRPSYRWEDGTSRILIRIPDKHYYQAVSRTQSYIKENNMVPTIFDGEEYRTEMWSLLYCILTATNSLVLENLQIDLPN